MRKVYLDMTEANCTSVFVKDAKVIPAGTTVYSMQVKDKNEEYQRFAAEYDIHFIFDDNIPKPDFYTIPYVDIMAVDSCGGYIGTIGEMSGPESDAPICYINKNRSCFLLAENFKELTENPESWKTRLKPYDEIEFFRSKAEAREKYEFPDTDIFFKPPMEEAIKEYLGQYPAEIQELYGNLRNLIYDSTPQALEEKLWAKLPSYYAGASVVRLIPFKDHINVEARAIVSHKDLFAGYKITPKGMLQIYLNQDLPIDSLKRIFAETLFAE